MERVDKIIQYLFARGVAHPHVRVQRQHLVAYRLNKMGLPNSGVAVNIERIVTAGRMCHHLRRGKGVAVLFPDHKIVKCMTDYSMMDCRRTGGAGSALLDRYLKRNRFIPNDFSLRLRFGGRRFFLYMNRLKTGAEREGVTVAVNIIQRLAEYISKIVGEPVGEKFIGYSEDNITAIHIHYNYIIKPLRHCIFMQNMTQFGLGGLPYLRRPALVRCHLNRLSLFPFFTNQPIQFQARQQYYDVLPASCRVLPPSCRRFLTHPEEFY